MKDSFANMSDSESEDIWKNKTDFRYSKNFIESSHQEILKHNPASSKDLSASRKSAVSAIVFICLSVLVFLVLYYFNFIIFGHGRLHSNLGIQFNQITLLGLSSFAITSLIWNLMDRVFKIGPPFK
jgi:hypothetical protein